MFSINNKNKINGRRKMLFAFFVGLVFAVANIFPGSAYGALNKQINYQGKLTDEDNMAVTDASYNMEFKLYTVDTGGTAIWTETRTGSNRVPVVNGLFSVMLGQVSSLASVNFNQTLYLSVNIGGIDTTPTWDGEMSPRKILGVVPGAIESEHSAKASNLVGGNSTTLLGAIPYQSNTDTTSLLSPNTTTTKKFLRMTGTGTNGATPAWDTLVNADIPTALSGKTYNGLSLTANATGFSIAGGTISKTLTVSDNATISGTNTGDVTLGTANGLSLLGQQLSLSLASASANGALSSTDWTTFNNKQNALTNPVTASTVGTLNYIPKFTAGTTIANSQIFDNGTNVGVGTTNPNEKFHNVGNFRNEGTFKTGAGSEPGRWRFRDASGYLMSFWDDSTNWDTWGLYWDTSDNEMRWMGGGNLKASVDLDDGSGYFQGNVGIGTTTPSAKLDISAGNLDLDNTTNANQFGVISKNGTRFIHDFNYGNNGTVTTEGGNTFVGLNAGNLTMGSTATQTYHASYNTGIGYYSLYSNITGSGNSAQGYQSLYSNTTGANNSALGYYSLYSNTTGANNSALGYVSLGSNSTGAGNSALGTNAGRYISDGTTGRTTGNYGLYLGYNTKASADGTSNEIVIGYDATGQGSNTAVIGNSSLASVYLGSATPNAKLYTKDANISSLTASKVVFTDASKNLTSTGIGTSSQFIKGDGSLDSNTYLTSASGVSSFSAGTTGLTPSSATSGAITLGGTLNVANGGTGISSYTVGDLLYASGATTLSKLTAVTANQPLISKGTATAPAYAGYYFGGTAGQTYTFPTTTATLARTDSAQTFSGIQTFNALPAFNGGTTGSTAPFTVDSDYLVSNLNADLLDGQHASAFQPIDSDLTEIADLPDGPGLLRKNDGVCGSYTVTGQDGLTYGTVLGADGKCWLDRNLGATQVATSSTDLASYGDLYQWGRLKDGHQVITSGTTATLSTGDNPEHDDFILNSNTSPYDWRSPQNNNLWQGVSGTNNVCPAGFRLPTKAEWSTLVSAENITNSASAFSSSLKLPVAGNREHSSGGVSNRGSSGYYWSSSVTGVTAYSLHFNASAVYYFNKRRAYGFSVRCVKDSDTWTLDNSNYVTQEQIPSNIVTGTGIANYVPKWTGTTTQGNSLIYDDGINVGIGTTSPSELLSLGTAGTKAGTLSLAGATSGKAIIQTSAVAGTPTLTLPATTGTLALVSDISNSYVPYTGATSDVNLGTYGLTTTNLSASGTISLPASSIQNTMLANSSLTIGTTAISLGSSSTTLAGLSSVTSTSFVGALTGNASSSTYSSAVTLTADNSTNATNYPLFTNAATGNLSPRTDTGFTYNPSTGVLTSTTFSGALSGNATTATTLQTARTIAINGGATGTATSFNGSANISIPITSLTASYLSGTIPSAVLGNSTTYVGTTAIALNRASANQALTGISSITLPGSTSGTATITPNAVSGTTALTLPATSGTLALTSQIPSVPTGANPTATIGLSAINGTATTFMRSDASPALSQAITPTWTGVHTFNAIPNFNGGTSGSTAPFTVDSTFLVSNLNADLLDGHEGSYYSPTSHTHTLQAVTNAGAVTTNDLHINDVYGKIAFGLLGSDGDVHMGSMGNGSPTYGNQDYGFYNAYNAYRGSDGNWYHTRTPTAPAVRYTGSPSFATGLSGFNWDTSPNVGTGVITWTNIMNLSTAGVLSVASLNTGQGANELYAMNQNVRTTDSPTFANIIDSGLTSGYLPYANVSKQLTNSPIYTDGTNVGIGTTSPKNKLDIEGGAVIGATYSGTNTAPTNGLLVEGNVGIGTTSPNVKLQIVDGGTVTSGYPVSVIRQDDANVKGLIIGNDAVDSLYYRGMRLSTNASGDGEIDTYVNGAYQDLILNGVGGNVGIGTTSPGSKFDINNTVNGPASVTSATTATNSNIVISANPTTYTKLFGGIGDSTYVWFQAQNTSNDSLKNLSLNPVGGSVGIGTTTPQAKLDISEGNLDLDNTTNANQFGVISKNGTRFIHDFNYGNNGTVTTDGANTFVGINSGNLTMGLTATTAGQSSYNTGVGYGTLQANTTGYQNSAQGYASLYYNTTGYNNSAQGAYSLRSNTTGSNNSAQGVYSLYSNTTGNYNSALGLNAGRYISDGTTGRTTGNYGLYLGYNTKASADGTTNEIVIGYDATGAGDNTAVIGNSLLTSVYLGSATPNAKLYAKDANISSLTASKVVFTDASKNLTSTGIGTSSQFIKGDGSLDSNTYLTSASLTGYVPYTGATTDVVLGAHTLSTTSGIITPKIYPSSDSTTAIQFNKADGTTNVLNIDTTNGNVGIGTTSPLEKLHLVNTSAGVSTYPLMLENKDSTINTKVGIKFAPTLYGNVRYSAIEGVQETGTEQIGLAFITGSTGTITEKMRIRYDGNVGIGTTTPSQKLDVSGNININTNGTNALISTYKGADSDGYNIFIGGGGQSSIGEVGATNKGSSNTANGYQALYSNTTGYYNTANGYQALFSNTTGYYNTANGLQALYSNTTGYYNSALGYASLYFNTTGSSNTANGYQALYSNTTGYYNTANGLQALYSNTTGTNNTANGYQALYSNTTGYYNTANGYRALFSNTTGTYNTANGMYSLYSNTTGNDNSAQGAYSLRSNTTGSYNSALGYYSLYYNTTGSYNSALGTNAGRYISDGTTGRETGNYGLYLGYNTKAGDQATTNEIVIGYDATGAGSNTAVIGNSFLASVYLGSTTPNAKLYTKDANISSLTASKVVFTDASKNLTSTGIGTSSQFIKGDGSLDSNTYLTSASLTGYVPYTGATTNVNLGSYGLTSDTITISNTNAVNHLAFSRGSLNYITAPTSGSIAFVVNGQAVGSATSELTIQDGSISPGTTNVTSLGTSGLRWSNTYSVLGNFSGLITGSAGATISGNTISLNDSSNYAVNIATGTSTGAVNIGGTGAQTISVGAGATNAKTINIGTGAVANTIAIGSSSATNVSITDNNWSIATNGTASFAGLTSPTAKLTNLTDGYVPYHISDSSGLANSNIYYDGTNVGVGTTAPETTLSVRNSGYRQVSIRGGGTGHQTLNLGSVESTIGSYIYNNAYYSGSYNYKPSQTSASGIQFQNDGSIDLLTNTGLTIDTSYTPTSRIKITNDGKVGIGTTSPTAVLHLKAGTASQYTAPLKFTSSGANLLTTPEAGAMEYNGTDLFFTPSSGTRETVAFISDVTGASHNAVTLGAIGSTPNANGMTLTGQVLNLEPASASYGGIITTGTQTFAGAKTFNGALTASSTLTANGAIVLGDGGDDVAINSNDWDISSLGAISGITTLSMSGQLTSTLADGTAPFNITSTTMNPNLNADLLDGKHSSDFASYSDSTFYIEGTGTVAGTWLGTNEKITSYYDGLTVRYYIPIAGASTTTLNIGGLGAKTVYLYGATKLTTHYPATSVITLTYSSTKNGGCWYVEPYYADGTESYTVRWNSTLQAGAPINSYKLVMFGATDGKVYPLTAENGTATTKTVSSVEFNPMTPVLYYGRTTPLATGEANSSYWYEGASSTSLNYTANQASGFTAYTPIYLKGTINANGNFVLAGAGVAGSTDFLTQTLPTTDDGFVYMLLGHMYNTTTSFRLTTSHPIYEYKGGKLRPYIFETDTLETVMTRGATTTQTPTFSNATYSALFTGGKVGIGTTTPSELLSLGTAGTTAGTLSLAGATSGKAIIQTSAVAGTPTLTLPATTGTLALTSQIASQVYPSAGIAVSTGSAWGTSYGTSGSGNVALTTSPSFTTPSLGVATATSINGVTITNGGSGALTVTGTASISGTSSGTNTGDQTLAGLGGAPVGAKYIVQTADASLTGEQALGALGTGILKNTTSTGVLSIAVAGDFPTLNQNTTGSAATLTTSRTIWGQSFNGSGNVSGAISGATSLALNGATSGTVTITPAAVAGTPTLTLPTTSGTLALTSDITSASHAPVTIGSPANGLSLSTQQLSLGLASTSATGALSSTDWNTFNNKQNALGFTPISNVLTSAKILVGNASNVATAVTMSGDVAIANNGTTTIQANSVALSTDTTGNYVAGLTAGTGIAITGTAGEGWSPTVSFNYASTLANNPTLAANQTTFASNGVIFEGSTADTYEGLLTATNPTADNTWTLPNKSGTVAMTSDITAQSYPSAGIAVSTGTAWGTSIANNSANWNTAYGWGNHASAGYLLTTTAASTYVPYTGATGAVNLGANNLTVDTNTLFVDSVNHRVGIGTTSPVHKLDVVGSAEFSVGDGALRIVKGGSGYTGIYYNRIYNSDGFNLTYFNGSSETSGIKLVGPTGNVGIGTSSPLELLSLGTAGTKAGTLSLAGATSGKAIINVSAVAGTPTLTLPTTSGTLALTSDITSASHAPVTIGSPANGLSLSTQQLSLGLASTSATGALSSTDWNTFNNKQNALGFTPISNVLTSAKILVGNASNVATAVTMSGDVAIANNGTTTIQANSVALSTDTTGNYVAGLTNGNGIATSGTAGEGWSPTIALGALTANWSQTGAYDIVLGSAGSELQIMGSAGTYYGTLDTGALTASRTYTFPDKTGTVAMTSDIVEVDTLATVTSRGSITNGQSITVGPSATYDPIIISAIAKGTTSFTGTITSADLTANTTWTLPATGGTIARTADLHSPVTLGTANGLSLSGQQISIGLASTSTTGALSATDWNTFNNKQGALTAGTGIDITGGTISLDEYYTRRRKNAVSDNDEEVMELRYVFPSVNSHSQQNIRDAGIYGSYDTSKVQHIWSAGGAYRVASDGSTFGTLKGLAYQYNGSAGGDGIYMVQDGTATVGFGTNLWTSGKVLGATVNTGNGDMELGSADLADFSASGTGVIPTSAQIFTYVSSLEADTLATVTSRGSVTNGQSITVGPSATYDPIIISAKAKGTTSFTGTITSADLTANRTWTFPNKDGTVAMTSDIPAQVYPGAGIAVSTGSAWGTSITTSSGIAGAISDETGTGSLVFSASPTLTGTLTAAAATLSGTLTANGTFDANGLITLGDGGDTITIDSSDWDITATGVMSGISGIANNGSYTQTGTNANTFTGTSTFSNATYSALFTGGNVGIGTSTPTDAKLVISNSGTIPAMEISSPNLTTSEALVIYAPASTGISNGKAFSVAATNASFASGMFYSDGKYGIGPGTGARDVYLSRPATSQLKISSDAGTGAADLLVTGKVGLGLSSPTYTLDTVGDFRIKGTTSSASFGVSWYSRGDQAYWFAIDSSYDGSKLVSGRLSGYIYTSSDSGESWTQQTNSGSYSWSHIVSSSDGTKIAGLFSQSSAVRYSSDGGVTWTNKTTPTTPSNIAMSSDGTKLAVYSWVSPSLLYISTNSGDSWTSRTIYSGSDTIDVCHGLAMSSDGTKIYLTCDTKDVDSSYSRLMKSTNSGTSWTSSQIRAEYYDLNQNFYDGISTSSDGAVLFAAVSGDSGYNIMKSTDSGASWVSVGNAGQYGDIDVSADGLKVVVARSSGYVYTSTNGGTNWVSQTASGSRNWIDITVSGNGSLVGAVVNGSGQYIYISTSSPTSTVITSGGLVGIMRTDPSVALDVYGDIEYTGTITDVSDMRLKENITEITGVNALSIVSSLQAKSFNMKDTGKKEIGYIAQEVNEIFPDAVSIVDPEEGYLGINYMAFIPLATESIKELNLNLNAISGTIVPVVGSSAETFANNFFANMFTRIGAWLADAANGLERIFVREVRTQKLCIINEAGEETCVERAELQNLLNGAAFAEEGNIGEETEGGTEEGTDNTGNETSEESGEETTGDIAEEGTTLGETTTGEITEGETTDGGTSTIDTTEETTDTIDTTTEPEVEELPPEEEVPPTIEPSGETTDTQEITPTQTEEPAPAPAPEPESNPEPESTPDPEPVPVPEP